MNTSPRTPEEHREFIREVIKLFLFFAAEYLRKHPEETIDSAILRRTSIWEITGIQNSELEKELTERLKKLYGQAKTSGEFEEHGWRMLEPHLEWFLSENLRWEKNVLAKYNGSCVRYDAPSTCGLPADYCNFHITNSIAPKSILAEERYTAECLLRLMDAGEKEFGYGVLRTLTWLNSSPQWLKFFPRQWQENLEEPCNIVGKLGSWGQIITSRKTFNYKQGEYIRTNLELKYKPRASWCTFAVMRKHLAQFITPEEPRLPGVSS
ncbi:MAG: hypothetical protein PHP98_02925 [Kiritimatiellae bacterium]|nr:hypothetical protein [Kiritimatiellia bacterium]